MKPIIISKKFELTDEVRERAQRKLNKLNKFFSDDTEATVTLTELRGRVKVEITIVNNGTIFRAEETDKEAFYAIDHAVDVIERQIRKNRTRLEKRMHFDKQAEAYQALASDAEDEVEEEIKVFKVKRYDFQPMLVEEAIMQMNLLSHDFYMFKNAETGEFNVVYKRKDNDYGVIMPKS